MKRQAWNATQIHCLLHLRDKGAGYFDRWNKLVCGGKPLTSGGSTTGFTLFRRGWIETDGKTVTITALGRSVLKEFGV